MSSTPKSVSITRAKRDLARLAKSQEPVQVTVRGQPAFELRLIAQPVRDPEAARRAVERIKLIGAKYKPSKKHGGTRAVRELRDRGE